MVLGIYHAEARVSKAGGSSSRLYAGV